MGNKALRTVGTAVAIGLVATISLGSITGCSGNKSNGDGNTNTSQSSKKKKNNNNNNTDWKNATAATFNGSKITEQEVNDFIDQYRKYNSYTDDTAWAKYLKDSNLTAETVRKNAINQLAEKIAVKAKCDQEKITVSDKDVNNRYDEVKKQYAQYGNDSLFDNSIKNMGYTEQSYKDDLKYDMLRSKLLNKMVKAEEPSDSDMQKEADENAKKYTGKKSYNVVFKVDDTSDTTAMDAAKKKAQAFIDDLKKSDNVDEALFSKKAKELVDKGTASEASDVGWSGQNSFVTAYTDALDKLEVGKYTEEPVESSYGYHVIFCEDEFMPNATGGVTLATMPDDLKEVLKTTVKQSNLNKKQDRYLSMLVNDTSLNVKGMPKGLPYDVDMKLANDNSNNNNNSNDASANATATNADTTADSSNTNSNK